MGLKIDDSGQIRRARVETKDSKVSLDHSQDAEKGDLRCFLKGNWLPKLALSIPGKAIISFGLPATGDG